MTTIEQLPKPQPRRNGTEEELRIEQAIERIRELQLQMKGKRNCPDGCGGSGHHGIRTLAMDDGSWEPMLVPCRCARPSEYMHTINAMAQMMASMQLKMIPWTFWGGIAWFFLQVGTWAWVGPQIVHHWLGDKPQTKDINSQSTEEVRDGIN